MSDDAAAGEATTSWRVDGGVARLVIASPRTANALGAQEVRGLQAGLDAALDHPQVRLVVLASEGPVFSSGSNVEEFARKGYDELSVDYQELILLYESFAQSSKPTIARVQGDAYGGAIGLIAACDIVLAAESARFAFSEVRLGFAPTLAAIPVLRRVRPADAREMFLTGRRFDARHAASIGLVNACVADDDLDDEVDRVARDICRGGPRALTIARSIVRSASSLPSEIAYDHVLQFSREFVASEESREGVQAFLEGRSPSW